MQPPQHKVPLQGIPALGFCVPAFPAVPPSIRFYLYGTTCSPAGNVDGLSGGSGRGRPTPPATVLSPLRGEKNQACLLPMHCLRTESSRRTQLAGCHAQVCAGMCRTCPRRLGHGTHRLTINGALRSWQPDDHRAGVAVVPEGVGDGLELDGLEFGFGHRLVEILLPGFGVGC